jgi:DNA-binding Lrp family transcriptional regulator
MISAIVLVKADPKRIPQCATKLAGIEGVSRVYSVSGEWDLVALIEVPDFEAVARVVTEEFGLVSSIERTQTLTAFRVYSKGDLEQAWDIGVD